MYPAPACAVTTTIEESGWRSFMFSFFRKRISMFMCSLSTPHDANFSFSSYELWQEISFAFPVLLIIQSRWKVFYFFNVSKLELNRNLVVIKISSMNFLVKLSRFSFDSLTLSNRQRNLNFSSIFNFLSATLENEFKNISKIFSEYAKLMFL
jgi:hypothetical protein